MARICVLRILFFISIVVLSACHTNHQTNTPNLPTARDIARENAHQVFNYLHQGYTDKAYEKLQLALQQAPDDPVILDTAGYYYEKIGLLKIANQYYKSAIAAAPHSGITKNNYGAFLCRNGHYKSSIPYFIAASKERNTPVCAEALRNAAYCKQQMQSRLGDEATSAYYTQMFRE